jgi:hypothetical protein
MLSAVIPDARKRDPESMHPVVVMDSGFAALRRPGLTGRE